MKFSRFILVSLAAIALSGLISSCKSHKKVVADSGSMTEKQIETKIKKETKTTALRTKIVEECKDWIGTPYKYGKSEKGEATDCSGMILVVYEEITGIKLPRNSAKQAEYCHQVTIEEILPGDLVFFATGKDPEKVSHVGLMMDKNNFVHASSSKGVVISEMSNPYYKRTFIKYGRIPDMKGK